MAHLLRLPGPQRHDAPDGPATVESLPHIDALLDGTRGSRFFTKLDLASSYHQLRVRAADRWQTSLRSQLGQFEWNSGARSSAFLAIDSRRPARGAVHRQVGNAMVVRRGAPLHGARQLLPPLYGGPRRAGGGPSPAGVPTLPARRRGAPAGRMMLCGFRPADRQPVDHVAQDEPASEQDVRPLARRDRGLPLRRDAPARRTQPDGPAVAKRIRGRRRPRGVDGRPGPKISRDQLIA